MALIAGKMCIKHNWNSGIKSTENWPRKTKPTAYMCFTVEIVKFSPLYGKHQGRLHDRGYPMNFMKTFKVTFLQSNSE